MSFLDRQPKSLSPYNSDDDEPKIDVNEIIAKSKIESKLSINSSLGINNHNNHNNRSNQNLTEQLCEPPTDHELEEKELDQIELEMLVEECEELIGKISPNINNFYIQDQNASVSDPEESFSMKREKNRLEKQYIQLCLEIQRQQKQLQNYRFKVQVAQKQAQYYSRQIKEKSAILQNLQQHSLKKGRQSFSKR